MSEKLLELFKRRGFVWQSYEIYGGVSGFYDFGPLGVKIIRKIENVWKEFFVNNHDFIFEIITPIVTPEVVLEASGHLKHFTDIMIQCLKCKRKFRIDNIIGEEAESWSLEKIKNYIIEKNIKCPECNGELGEPEYFNLLMKTTIGPYSENIGYLRPEAAQGIFVNFKKIYELTGKKLPLGIFQIGKVNRNEISPRKGLLRLREFTIIDLEIFYDKDETNCPYISTIQDNSLRILFAENRKNFEIVEVKIKDLIKNGKILSEWLAYFMWLSQEFILNLGIDYKDQFFLEKLPEERAHYSTQTFDHIVKISTGEMVEIAGHSLRTDYDLKGHSLKSKANLFAEKINEEKKLIKFYPYVVEPSFGLERIFLCVLDKALTQKNNRLILKLPYKIVPYQTVVAPLVKKDNLPEFAYKVYELLKKENIDAYYDDSEYIGKVYAKADEIGVPFCITIDYQSLQDNSVTIRNRDDWSQIRVSLNNLVNILRKLLNKEVKFEECGKILMPRLEE